MLFEPCNLKLFKLWFVAGRVRWETGVPSIAKRRVDLAYHAGPAVFFAVGPVIVFKEVLAAKL